MRSILIKICKGAALMAALTAFSHQPAHAVLEGPNRERLEYLDFSEKMVRSSLYATQGNQAFNKSKRRFVRGIRPSNDAHIYQADVYTWELAMAEHQKKLARMAPPAMPGVSVVTPVPMAPGGIMPTSPQPLYLTPSGPDSAYETTGALPPNANQMMNNMVYRARARGLHPDRPLRAEEIKQKLINHLNSMGTGQPGYGNPAIPALLPALPDLPKGTRGDSFDGGY